jgi:hypothetical protein
VWQPATAHPGTPAPQSPSGAPLRSGQARPLRPLHPVRPRVGADDPTAGAHHPRAEGGYGTSLGQRSTASTASWWQSQQLTESERTPCARMLPSVRNSEGRRSRHLYGPADFAHTPTSGLLAAPLPRQMADRSVGKLVGFLVTPHQAVTRTSSASHCTVQDVVSQADRTSRTPAAGPGGPVGPTGPGGPGSPCGP